MFISRGARVHDQGQLESLSIARSNASVAPLAALLPSTLRQLRTIDMSGLSWGGELKGSAGRSHRQEEGEDLLHAYAGPCRC